MSQQQQQQQYQQQGLPQQQQQGIPQQGIQQQQHLQQEQLDPAQLQQYQQQYQQHQQKMAQQQRELQQAAQAVPAAPSAHSNGTRSNGQSAPALGTQALQGGQSGHTGQSGQPQTSAQSYAAQQTAQRVPQPTVRPTKPTQEQLQKPLPQHPSQAQQHSQSSQYAQSGSQHQYQSQQSPTRSNAQATQQQAHIQAEQVHVNQQPFFRPHEKPSQLAHQQAAGAVPVPARSSSIKRTSAYSQSQRSKGSNPMMSYLTAAGFLLLALAIFVKDPLHRRGVRVHMPKDHGGDKGQTPIGDSERLNAWKHVPVKELRVDESFWNKEKPFNWPNAKRLVVFGDETVSSAAGNAHGHPNGLNDHKGLRWTDYLYKSFMDDDALYHNLATVGSTAADIDQQIKAFQSMSAVQDSNFRADDTLFIIGSGEAAVKPLDGTAAKAGDVTRQVKDLMDRAEQLWTAGGRSFLFIGLREAGDDGRAREHWNAELGDALNKFKKAHPAANVMFYRYADWFDAVRANPDIVGITECKRDIEPNTDSARLGFCIDTFGDETWPVDRLLSHAVNGYLVKHSRVAGGKKTEAKTGKSGKAKESGKGKKEDKEEGRRGKKLWGKSKSS